MEITTLFGQLYVARDLSSTTYAGGGGGNDNGGGGGVGGGDATFLVHGAFKEEVEIEATTQLFVDMQRLAHPCLLHQLCRGETSDAMWCMYTPALHPHTSLAAHLCRLQQVRRATLCDAISCCAFT
jgi:hypothetical protein